MIIWVTNTILSYPSTARCSIYLSRQRNIEENLLRSWPDQCLNQVTLDDGSHALFHVHIVQQSGQICLRYRRIYRASSHQQYVKCSGFNMFKLIDNGTVKISESIQKLDTDMKRMFLFEIWSSIRKDLK